MELQKYSLFKQGIYIEKMTSKEKLAHLINRIIPVKTKFNLVRIGSENDGGYLIPNDLWGIKTCFSPGVDINASFEIDLLNKNNIKSHLADYSVDAPPVGFEPLSFTKKFLGAYDDEIYITLDSWVRESLQDDSEQDCLLQMDIEGGEYLSLLAASEKTIKKFRIMVVEIHDVEAWGVEKFFDVVNAFFSKLLEHFYIVHNHPNNCCGVVDLGGVLAPRVFELTFLRRDRAEFEGFCNLFPHPLDRPNLLHLDDLPLPINWFSLPNKIDEDCMDSFLNEISGVIHIGASVGQESSLYHDLNLDVAWVEAIPEVFKKLQLNIHGLKKQVAYNYLLTDKDSEFYNFNISNNQGESSSILEMALHSKIWPDIQFTHTLKIRSSTMLSMVKNEAINLNKYQALILDTQGSELLIIKGAAELINRFKYIKIEVPDFESYLGCCQLNELTKYLSAYGFKQTRKEKFAEMEGVGAYYDVLFERNSGDGF
jgi:FkbM family methyltransferase